MFLTLPSSDDLIGWRYLKRWMATGIASLALGGVFAVLLVLSRTPAIQPHLPFIDFFHTALVVHVDLTVLVWFLSNAFLVWFIAMGCRASMAMRAGWWCFNAGMLVMVASAFVPNAMPLINNYVPVLQHPLFMMSLSLMLAAMLLIAGEALWRIRWLELVYINHEGKEVSRSQALAAVKSVEADAKIVTMTRWRPLHFGAWSAAVIALCAILAWVASYLLIPDSMAGKQFYESLFWGGGHILQFVHTQLMLVVWAALGWQVVQRLPLARPVMVGLFGFALVAVATSVIPYMQGEAVSYEFHRFFTLQMIWFGGTYVIPVAIGLLWILWRCDAVHPGTWRPVQWTLLVSVLVFGAGGVVSTFIDEINLVIPAHYHGSIVGVSLAYIALYFWLLPQLGVGREGEAQAAMWGSRWAQWQPVIYGGGQLLFVIGYFIAGHWYGVERKSTEGLEEAGAKFAMHLANGGGGFAILGGMLFVILAWRWMVRPPVSIEH